MVYKSMGCLYCPVKAVRKPPVIIGNNVRKKVYMTSHKVLLNNRSEFIEETEDYGDGNSEEARRSVMTVSRKLK
jgi:hypothetical protein